MHFSNGVSSWFLSENQPSKHGEVLPFLKSGDAMDKTNYRPVTILPTISKVFEKCLCPQLTSYFETIFPPTLNAHRKNHSCCSTLLKLTEDWKAEADSNNIIGATLIDLSKAFDRLPHNLLLEKLSAYGVSLESLELLTNYVKNRTQCVRLGNTRSTTGKLMSGVPQGSVLGPHLFNIFINDLFYNIKKAKISAYADDKQLYFSNANARIVQKTLNSELAVVSRWITDNGLLLNPKKCESLIFRRTNPKHNQTEEEKINFSVDGTLIEPSTTCKLLGVHIDERLNFNNHVASICKKTSKQIAVISRFRKLLSIQTKLTLYKAYILPHFTYCSTVWMHCGKTASDKLEKLNKRDLRLIFNDNANTYATLLETANMPSLHDRRVQDMCILIYKVIHGITPTPLRNLLTLRSKSRNLRGELILVQPRVITTKYGLNTFRYYGPKIWNSLNDELRTSPTLKKFVTRIRKITFDACNCSLCNC